jgi:hypothetical protein
MMEDVIGIWPGDQPKAINGIPFSMAIRSEPNFTMFMQELHMVLARIKVWAE